MDVIEFSHQECVLLTRCAFGGRQFWVRMERRSLAETLTCLSHARDHNPAQKLSQERAKALFNRSNAGIPLCVKLSKNA
jgi:hypothetical protein